MPLPESFWDYSPPRRDALTEVVLHEQPQPRKIWFKALKNRDGSNPHGLVRLDFDWNGMKFPEDGNATFP